MSFVYTRQDEKVVLMLLRILTVFFVVCIVSKIWTSVATVRAARAVADAAIRASTTSGGATPNDRPGTNEATEPLRQKNLFAPATSRQNPIVEVTGVLGGEAFINGRWCRVGDMIGEARLSAVEATCVKVVWEGQTLSYSPIQAADSSTSDRRQLGGQYASSARLEPAREKDFQAHQPTAWRAETTARNESYRPIVDASRGRTTFSPGPERSFKVVPDPVERMRRIAEIQHLTELSDRQQRPPESSAGPK